MLAMAVGADVVDVRSDDDNDCVEDVGEMGFSEGGFGLVCCRKHSTTARVCSSVGSGALREAARDGYSRPAV